LWRCCVRRRIGNKAPSTKRQAPEKSQIPSSNANSAHGDFKVWNLEFPCGLDPDTWSFQRRLSCSAVKKVFLSS
jgi:hypothetical protein